jgi:chemotaxis-related protein WspB
MLFLLVGLGTHRYALDAGQVVEVLPLVHVTPVPQAPSGIAGVFLYHGTPVPTIDLSELLTGMPARRNGSTRLILVDCRQPGGPPRMLGFIAEYATETIRRERSDFVSSGIASQSAALDLVAQDAGGIIQYLDPQAALSAPVRDALSRGLVV